MVEDVRGRPDSESGERELGEPGPPRCSSVEPDGPLSPRTGPRRVVTPDRTQETPDTRGQGLRPPRETGALVDSGVHGGLVKFRGRRSLEWGTS